MMLNNDHVRQTDGRFFFITQCFIFSRADYIRPNASASATRTAVLKEGGEKRSEVTSK